MREKASLTATIRFFSLVTNIPSAALSNRYYKTALVLSGGAISTNVTTEPVGMSSVTLQAGNNPLAVPLPRLADYRG